MSRHRIVRTMNYSDEYDGYDDVYGHSVEDDYSMSPSEAAFMYDRNNRQQAQISAFLTSDNIAEEDESETSINDGADESGRRDSQSSIRPHLSDIDEARLRSCLDEVRNVIGDSFAENILVDTILRSEFDVTRTLDELLKSPYKSKKEESPKPQRVRNPLQKEKQGTGNTGSSDVSSQIRSGIGEMNLRGESPTITVAVAPSKPVSIIKGFEFPSTNKSNIESGLKIDRPQTPKSNCNSPEPERKLQCSGDGDNKSTPNVQSKRNSKKAEEEWKKLRSGGKEQLHMVTIGHVDAGKSTLMGHLLYRLGRVNQKTMHKYEQESKKLGKQSFAYAWILDETGEERTRGITMDVGQSQLETNTKSVTLLDAPGHKDFIPNMITGAAQADVGLLVVDATRGEFETGFESGGQTREHALLVRSLGVSQLCVAINKLDTVNWSEERFKEIVNKMKSFLKQAGFRDSDVTFVPCSGLTGENLTAPPTEKSLSDWYTGPCLIEVIDKFKCPERPVSKPLRLSVNDIYKGTGSGFCISGKVETGMVQQGDKVLVQPQNEIAVIKALSIEEVQTQSAFAGDYVSVTISNYDQQNMAVGYVLSDPHSAVPTTTKFEARIVVFNVTIPITRGFQVILHQQSLVEPAFISRLIAQLHKSTGEVVKQKPRCLQKNSTALVVIETGRPICIELYRDVKELGRFMLRVSGATIAAGLVTKIM